MHMTRHKQSLIALAAVTIACSGKMAESPDQRNTGAAGGVAGAAGLLDVANASAGYQGGASGMPDSSNATTSTAGAGGETGTRTRHSRPSANCVPGAAMSCNDDSSISDIEGSCTPSADGNTYCTCNTGFGLRLETGKCAVRMTTPLSVCGPAHPEVPGDCSGDASSSAINGICLFDGTCYCLDAKSPDPATGLCI
jgi:hypothetical protein